MIGLVTILYYPTYLGIKRIYDNFADKIELTIKLNK